MTQPRDIQPALAHLESALEASCATLIALQAGVLAMPDAGRESGGVRAQLTRAIESVRDAISELRALHDTETSMLAFGFVLSADHPAAIARGQLTPRRTA
jgi:hypothetical protein